MARAALPACRACGVPLVMALDEQAAIWFECPLCFDVLPPKLCTYVWTF